MGVYEGLQIFKRDKSEIRVKFIFPAKGYLIPAKENYNWRVEISNNEETEEKVMVLIHEALHLSSEFREYLKGLKMYGDHPVEKK